jgi:hypothetical protein
VARTTAWGNLGGTPVVEDNRLCYNTLYNVLNGSDFNLELEKNCFCLSDSAAIEAKIYDGYDDITRGLLNFAVYDSTCTTQVYRVMKVNILSEGESTAPAITAYPNPVADLLVLEGLEPGILVHVMNALGQSVAEFRAVNPTETLRVAEWPRGIYFVLTESGEPLRIVKP